MDDLTRHVSQHLRRLAEQVENGEIESVIVCVLSKDQTKEPRVFMDGVEVPATQLHEELYSTRTH